MGPLGFGPHRFLSTKTHKQIDCAEKRRRVLAFTEFSRRMDTGKEANGYVDTGNWLPVELESINHAMWESCLRQGMIAQPQASSDVDKVTQ